MLRIENACRNLTTFQLLQHLTQSTWEGTGEGPWDLFHFRAETIIRNELKRRHIVDMVNKTSLGKHPP
jgi:hypothetical protein